MPKNPYEVLGLTSEATQDEIKKAYRQLALKHHPDTNPNDPTAEARFKEVNEAYQTIGDPEKREQFDRFGSSGSRMDGGGGMPPTHEEIMNYFMKMGMGGVTSNIRFGGFQSPFRNPMGINVNANVDLTLKEVLTGTMKQTKILIAEEVFKGQRVEVTEHVYEAVLNIPPGFQDGMILRTKIPTDKGDQIVNIQISVDPPDGYEIHSDGSVIAPLVISYPQAILGGTVDVDLLDGTSHKLVIPEGTQPGQFIRAKGQGLPKSPRDLSRGDFLFCVEVSVPKRIPDKAKEALKHFQAVLEQPSDKTAT